MCRGTDVLLLHYADNQYAPTLQLVKRRGKGGLANFGQLDAAMGMGDGDAPAAAVPTGIHTAHPTVAGAAATAAEAANAASRDVAELLLLASAFPGNLMNVSTLPCRRCQLSRMVIVSDRAGHAALGAPRYLASKICCGPVSRSYCFRLNCNPDMSCLAESSSHRLVC